MHSTDTSTKQRGQKRTKRANRNEASHQRVVAWRAAVMCSRADVFSRVFVAVTFKPTVVIKLQRPRTCA